VCAEFIAAHGEPALELGCGTGDPIIELRRRGIDVDGIDSSPDMLDICRRRADAAGVDVSVTEAQMETMDLGRIYRSIFLAGPTFNLLPDDDTARRALQRITAHLAPDGRVLIPLFTPMPVAEDTLGRFRDDTDEQGRTIRFATLASTRDDATRTQRATLRYERGSDADDSLEVVEREWLLHWYTDEGFRALVDDAGLVVESVSEVAFLDHYVCRAAVA
jgi:SAM-dependent methyltransferase